MGNPIKALALTADGRQAVSGHYDGLVRVWNLEANPRLLDVHSATVNAVAVSRNKGFVVSASDDLTLKLWDLGTGKLRNTLKGHMDRVRDVAMTTDGRMVVSVSDDGSLGIWELPREVADRAEAIEPKFIKAGLPEDKRAIFRVLLVDNDKRAVCATYNHSLVVFDLENKAPPYELKASEDLGPISAMAVSFRGQWVMTGHWGSRCVQWNWNTSKLEDIQSIDTSRVEALAITPDDTQVVVGLGDGNLYFWNRKTEFSKESTFVCPSKECNEKSVRALAMDANGRLVVSGSDAGDIILRDINTPLESRTLKGHKGNDLAPVSPDGQAVAL
jgi:WD40 repeat protein